MNDKDPSSMIEMFLANARDEPDRVVLNYKLGDEWQDLGWGVIARHASRYATVLRGKGVQAGDRVILVSETVTSGSWWTWQSSSWEQFMSPFTPL